MGGWGFVIEYFQWFQVEPWQRHLLAAPQLQDVFDYPVHSQSVVLNNLRQTSIDAFEFLGYAR